ncbi:MAG: hypothetical protein NTAFB01_09800 [Nitrospira sp.]
MRSVCYIGMGFVNVVISFGFLLVTGSAHAANEKGMWLITPDEAAMAPAKETSGRDLTQIGAESNLGPKIEVLKPPDGSSISSPVEVEVKFTRKMSPVDPTSLKVSVIKLIDIDITDRVRSYASADGIQVPKAQLPSSKHTVRISIADQDGLRSAKDVTFEILDSKP